MTRLARINAMSPEWLTLLSSRDRESFCEALEKKFDLVKMSTKVWLVLDGETPVCFVGLCKGTLLGHGAEFWFMPCAGLKKAFRRTVPFMRRGVRRVINLYGCAKSRVSVDFEQGHRFVEFLGFQCVAKTDQYYVYEQRASWVSRQ